MTEDAPAGCAFDYIMTDHPGWTSLDGARTRAFAVAEDQAVIVTIDDAGRLAHQGLPLTCDGFVFDLDTHGGGGVSEDWSRTALAEMGHVGRYRNPSLWDALGTAVTRQVVRAAQARKMYQDFCRAFGEPAGSGDTRKYQVKSTPKSDDGLARSDRVHSQPNLPIDYWLFPTPMRVLALDDDNFSSVGMAFKRRALRSAAEAYLEHYREWSAATPAELVVLLQRVPYIGPWTAAAAVADHTNDWSLYAYDDLAVRTWARHAMPDVRWAEDEPTFAKQWRHMSGTQLAAATLLTLAWGDRYVRSAATLDGACGG